MAYQVLYRTYRPARFSDVIGQDYIVKTLKNAIKTNKIAHAYLFCGPRGTGKTSVAKLFAKAVNCPNFEEECCNECPSCQAVLSGNHPDIIELDAASNNSVDDIREIVEQVNYAPMLGKYKVYIIDEVHMLSASAFNALLKTLEEPPAHVIFILATTDPQKVIPTVLSRCQRYNFSKIRTYDIRRHLIDVLKNEGIDYEDKAVEEIARLAEGGMRDALSILEQCLAYNSAGIYLEDIENIFGLTTTAVKVELLEKVHRGEVSEVISQLRDMYQAGTDMKRLTADLLEISKEALIYSDRGEERLLEKLNRIEAQQILRSIAPRTLLEDAKILEDTLSKDRQNQNFILYLELGILKMANTVSKDIVTVREETPVQKEEVKEEPKVEEKPENKADEKTEETKIFTDEDLPKEVREEIREEMTPDKISKDLLLSILLHASKDEKIKDELIYNRLDLYKLEADSRKFYEMLQGTGIFASSNDAIIVHGSETKVDHINAPVNNEELYRFINKEFGIDKMIYGVADQEVPGLIDEYRRAKAEKRNIEVIIQRYETEREETQEEKLRRLFGNVKVED
ncbi:MAG: DNA polymerase III subunit gamma/tau [Erysipelotrichaceae bacterium]|nr:DNA polymerase III subunit gamma/tau [Erysipelotrichaceae bacterium]